MVKSSESVEGNVTESQDDVKVVKKKLVLERKVVGGLKASTDLRAGSAFHGAIPWAHGNWQ